MYLLDCTLRDGANVVGKGFSAELTKSILEGLTANGVKVIEYGNAGGIGAYEVSGSVAPLTDEEYLELAQPYLGKGEIGMFLNAKRFREHYVELASQRGLAFLRVGADAGDHKITLEAIAAITKRGMKARYSLMKAYLLTPEKLAEECLRLEEAGIHEVTIMDSAGTMLPEDVARYAEALSKRLKIPKGFHGHNNLGLSAANALAAWQNGAEVLDCGLLGMARSAGNLSTENIVALLQQRGELQEIDFYGLLSYLDNELIPLMKAEEYHAPIAPVDLILGASGCHSSFLSVFREVAKERKVPLYPLIVEVSKLDRKSPSRQLMEEVAAKIDNSKGMVK